MQQVPLNPTSARPLTGHRDSASHQATAPRAISWALGPVLVFVTLSSPGSAQASAVVSPADRGALEGSTSTNYPLGRHNSRFQQLFDDLGASRILTSHAYRRDALSTRGSIASFRTSLEVRLSIAPLAAEKASKTFANNAGTTPTTVLPKTWVSFPKTTKPTTVPAPFKFRIPYKTPYVWKGAGTLCLDVVIDSNELSTGTGKTFSPNIDAQELFASGRNLQPGYRFGSGCTAPGQSKAATATFEIRHLGVRMDLSIEAKNGLPNTSATPTRSVLLLSPDATKYPWPHGTSCHVYGSVTVVLALGGNNTSIGGWKGGIPVGISPTAGFEMFGQILSFGAGTGPVVLSDASRLIAPPKGQGIVSSRIASASDRTAATGTISFSVPITEFR